LFAIRWREGSRLKQRGGFRTRKEAAEALARVRVGLSDGTLVEKRRASIGFDEVAKEWLRLHSGPNLRSHADNEERYGKHVAPFFGDVPLAAVTPTRLLEFRAKLQAQDVTRRMPKGEVRTLGRKLAPRTVNLTMALVRSILRFAVASGHIPASPTDRIGRGKLLLPLERPKIAPPIDTPEDVGRMLATVREIGEETRRPSLHALFATLIYTGMRRGEVLGLRWTDVDLERRMFVVRRSYAGTTKSSKHRPVPMPSQLVTILKAHQLSDPWKGELVFPNDAGEMYSRNAKLEEVLREALRRSGLRRVRVHDLRHQYASDFLRRGGDIFTLQRILGHSTPTLTSETYAHLSPGHLAGEADRVSYPEPARPAVVLAFDDVSA
jgi:integrase